MWQICEYREVMRGRGGGKQRDFGQGGMLGREQAGRGGRINPGSREGSWNNFGYISHQTGCVKTPSSVLKLKMCGLSFREGVKN